MTLSAQPLKLRRTGSRTREFVGFPEFHNILFISFLMPFPGKFVAYIAETPF